MYKCTFNICWVNGVQELRARIHRQPWAATGRKAAPSSPGREDAQEGGQVHPRKASTAGTPPQPMHYANASKWMFSLSDLKHCVRTDPVNLLCQGGLAEQPAKEAQFPSLPLCV